MISHAFNLNLTSEFSHYLENQDFYPCVRIAIGTVI